MQNNFCPVSIFRAVFRIDTLKITRCTRNSIATSYEQTEEGKVNVILHFIRNVFFYLCFDCLAAELLHFTVSWIQSIKIAFIVQRNTIIWGEIRNHSHSIAVCYSILICYPFAFHRVRQCIEIFSRHTKAVNNKLNNSPVESTEESEKFHSNYSWLPYCSE